MAVVCVAGFLTHSLKAQGPVVTASATSLNFSWVAGANLPASKNVSVRASSGTPAYTAITPAPDQWLIAEPDSGVLPATLVVQVNPSTLPPGIYNSSVTITVGGAVPLVIAVTLTVTSASGAVVVAPSTVTLTSPGTLTGTFTVTAGALAATFTATTTSSWLSISTPAGGLLPAQSQTVTVTANPAALNPSATAYAAQVTVATTTNGVSKTTTVTINLTVNPVTPVVSSIWPLQVPAGSAATEVTIRGANFYSGTTVAAAGLAAPLKTTIAGADALLTTIPAALLAAPGLVTLTVSNPAPGGPAAPVTVIVGNVSVISGITNSASYALGATSPGEIIAIFGQNIGPTPPVQLTVAAGFAQTSLGGLSVTIDGQAAPIVYASSTQVSVQVPYTAQLGTSAQGTARALVLTYGTATPAAVNIDIVSAAPGIFALNASGSGPALVLDYNAVTAAYSITSATNPANIGDTITFFATGEGDYASAEYPVETGFMVPLTPPVNTGVYPMLNPLPTVTIGGSVATVNYAGPIPGCMLGLLQINAVIPVTAPTGTTVPIVLTIGGVQTQANVTMAIK